MRRVGLALMVCGAVLAGPASASALTAEGPPSLVKQYAAAVEWWGQEPACPTVRLAEESVGAGYNGHGENCAIQIDPTTPSCALPELMEHEVGHLLGYQHSSDPHSIMYAEPHQFPGCERPPIEAQVAMYRNWVRRAVYRCRERAGGRARCFVDVREIRSELRARRRELASVPLPHH